MRVRVLGSERACVAVSADGEAWWLLGCCHGVREQVGRAPPIAGVLLCDTEPDDACAGERRLRAADLPLWTEVSLGALTVTAVPAGAGEVGLVVRDPVRGRALGWFPKVAGPAPELLGALHGCDLLLFDGTCWEDDEAQLRARQSTHWVVGGANGSLRVLTALPATSRVLVRVAATNPLRRPDSSERAVARALGVRVAEDGMELEA